MRGTLLGALLVVVLLGASIWSALHGVLFGVILAGPPALLFAAALVDNRYGYRRRTDEDPVLPKDDSASRIGRPR